jgi:hypothetical protein
MEKDNLEYFVHYSGSYRDGKFRMLRKRYGWEGEGRFWALNGIIAESSGCFVDLSKNYDKVNLIEELGMKEDEFDTFLEFLVNEVDLVVKHDNTITTDLVQEVYEKVKKKRNFNKEYYRKKKDEVPGETPEATEEKLPINNPKVETLTMAVMDFFDINETQHFRQMAEIGKALRVLYADKQIENFEAQFEWYKKLKASGLKHSLKNFLGTKEARHMDGAWNAENWKVRYLENQKTNGFETKTAIIGKRLTFDY